MSFATMSEKYSNKVSLLQFEENIDHGDAAVIQIFTVSNVWDINVGI